jgi:TonB-dependent SusC/RagA subfamily outer membrane receptor
MLVDRSLTEQPVHPDGGGTMSNMSSRTLMILALVAGGGATACGGSGQPNTAPAPTRPDAVNSGNAATVTAETIEQTPQTESVEKILAGRVAGVTVSRAPDGGLAVRIRGVSSLHGNNEPLYVLDGMPIAAGPGGSLQGINPHDIESIRVLKDPADTAMYGARGANGVIIIKTKQAKKD